MNALEAVNLHKQRFPKLADLPGDELMLFAQEIAREEKATADAMRDQHCAVCFAVLTEEERAQIGPASFHLTCTAHARFRKVPDVSRERSFLVKFPPFWKL